LKIGLSKFLSENLSVSLDPDFRSQLFESAVAVKGSVASIARHIGVHPCSVRRWRNGISFPKLTFLKKVADVAGVSEEEVYKNIVSVTAKRKSNAIPFVRELVVDEEFTEWFGLWKGDGCIRKALYDVAFSNEDPELHRFFMRMLQERFGFSKHLFYVSLRVPDSVQVDVQRLRVSWSKELELPLNRVKNYTKPSLGIVADLFASSAALAWLLKALEGPLEKTIEKSSAEIKRAYLRGYYAAEGSVDTRNHGIMISGKNFEELLFISRLLNSIKIQHRFHFYDTFGQIRVVSWQIREFQKLVGFGVNKKRQRALEKLVRSHEQHRLPQELRLAQIYKESTHQKDVTISRLMKRLNLSHERVRGLLHVLVDQRILCVDKRRRSHKFYLVNNIAGTENRHG